LEEETYVCLVGDVAFAQVGNQKKNQATKSAFTGSDGDNSSLEESVEEYKQPQTEEIMNAELAARVNLFRIGSRDFSIFKQLSVFFSLHHF
jgi:hypothetical protein